MTSMPAEQVTEVPRGVDRDAIRRVFEKQQRKAIELRSSTAEERIAKIRKLRDAVLTRKQALYDACAADFRKPAAEVDIGEVMPIVIEANHTARHLKKWMKPVKVRPTMALFGTKARVHYQPMGVNLIIAPWNYPVNLAICPLISAIGAGNTAIVKPSEMTPHSSAFVRDLLADLFDEDEVAVFEGDAEMSQALLELPFDHIFFTGSPAVGKIVMGAASKHLTKVTLELGGKSPTIVDETADLKKTARSIAFGKWANSGQTCVAPDYLYVQESVASGLADELRKAVEKSYGPDDEARAKSPDYCRIVNERHYGRVKAIYDDAIERGAKAEFGGDLRDGGENYVSPTLLTNVPEDGGKVMEEEIFGPLLPMVTYKDVREAIDHVNAGPKPLALYVYTKNADTAERVLRETSSGDACVNTALMQYVHANLPFGGVNNSGIGKAHGIYGFKAFSHERAVLEDKFSSSLMMAPPYTGFVRRMIDATIKYFT